MSGSVKVKIISGFDATGIRQAQAGMNAVRDSAGKAAVSNDNLAGSSARVTGDMRRAAAAASAMSGAMGQGTGGASVAARGLGAVLGAIGTGPVGIAIAGIGAITATLGYFKAKAEAAKKELEKLQNDMQNMRLDAAIAKWDKLSQAMETQIKYSKELRAINADIAREQAGRNVGGNGAQRKEPGAAQALGEAQVDYADAGKRVSLANGRVADLQERFERSGGEAKAKALQALLKAQEEQLQAINAYNISIAKLRLSAQKLDTATMEDAQSTNEKELEIAAMIKEEEDALDKKKTATEKATAAMLDVAQKESELASLQSDLARAIKDETDARNAAAKLTDAANQQASTRDAIAGKGASAFIAGREKDRGDATDEEKQNEKDAKRAARLSKKEKAGTKLSKRDEGWLDLYQEWDSAKKQGNAGGAKADAAKRQLNAADKAKSEQVGIESKLDENLKELQKLNQNLEKNLQMS